MATKLYVRTGNSDFGTGNNDANLAGTAQGWTAQLLSTSAGSSPVSFTTNTVTGPTNGIEVNINRSWISPPLDADITISGAITWNIWGSENNMSANVAINGRLEVIDGATGTITLIDQTARVIEMAVTTNAVNNFSETPVSGVACKRGDRLRVRIFGDDLGATAMATGFTFSVTIDGSTGGADGDTWLQLTENLTFVSEPAGTTVYPTDTASAVSTASVDREAWTSRGAGVQTDVRNTAAGWTAPLQITDTAGGTVVDWFTRPLTAFTLGGAVRVNARSLESNALANATLRCEIARVASDGTSPTVWGATTQPIEMGTTEAAMSFLVGGDDLAISDGQRIRVRFYIDDAGPNASAAMGAGQTVTLYYAGASGGASGDTYLTFTQTLTEFSAGTTVTPTTLALVLAAFAPTVTTSDHQLVTPTTATLAATAFAPTAPLGQILTPTTASLIIGGGLTTLASDTFTRSVTDGWGSADVGGAWTLTGTAANFDVNGSAGTIALTTGTGGSAVLGSLSTVDSDQTIEFSAASLNSGGTAQQIQLHSRIVSESSAEHYRGVVYIGGAGGVTVRLGKRVAASEVWLDGAPDDWGSGTISASTALKMRFQTVGASPTTVRFKAWLAASAEPAAWNLEASDSQASLQATNPVGVRYFNGSSFSGTITWDNYLVTDVVGASPPTVTVAAHQTATPITAALVLTTFAPTVTATVHQTVTPTTAALVLTTFAPSVTTPVLVTPTTASLALATFAATVTATAHQTATPTTLALTLATFAPTVTAGASVAVTPTTTALTLATLAATVTATDHKLATPTTAALALALFAPTVSLSDHKLATPTTITLTLTTYAPTVTASNHQLVTPTTKALVLTTFAPTVSTPRLATPTTLALTLTTFAATVTATNHQLVTPTTKALTLATFAPTVTATAHVTVTPTTKALALAFQAPSVTTGDAREVVPDTKALTLTTFAPTVTGAQNVTVTPTTKALTLAVFAPTVTATAHQLVTPTTKTLTLTLLSPIVTAGGNQSVTPTTKALTLTTFAPSVAATAHVVATPTTAALTLTTFAPTASIGYRITPTTASLTVTLFAPIVAVSDNRFVIPGTLPLVLTTFPPDAIGIAPTLPVPPTAHLVLALFVPLVIIQPPFDHIDGDVLVADPLRGVLVVTGPHSGATLTQTRGRTTLIVTTPRYDGEIESN